MPKRKRNQLYKEALKIYKDRLKRGWSLGICSSLTEACYELDIQIDPYGNEKTQQLPEFNRQNLKAKNKINDYWWPENSFKPRIKALEKMIEQTEKH